VTACDVSGPSPYSEALGPAGIPLDTGHDAAHVAVDPPPDRLAVTKALTAVDPDNAELAAARERGISVEPWQQVIADAAYDRTLVAVAGTHGKSTTSGWLVHLLVEAGLDPSAFVGALLPSEITGGSPATARTGRGTAFVVEADEYAGNFDAYRPSIAVLTSVEWDHPDVFADDAAVHEAFARWLEGIRDGGTIVANVADAGVAAVIGRVDAVRVRVLRVGIDVRDADVRGRIATADVGGTTLQLEELPAGDGEPCTVRLPTAGRHNAENAMAVIGAAVALGVPVHDIVRGLQTFRGVGRRLERKGEAGGIVVYDDYGHHPTAIRATIAAIRQREPDRRVWAVYEPLTYHRTAALGQAFAMSLATADAVAIADIWAGRDPDTTIASAAELAKMVAEARPGITAEAPGSVDATADWLARNVRAGDAVLVMGGGHSYRIATGLLERLHEDAARR
jgi:UDP-N-acetylmuramate--alanine ligase